MTGVSEEEADNQTPAPHSPSLAADRSIPIGRSGSSPLAEELDIDRQRLAAVQLAEIGKIARKILESGALRELEGQRDVLEDCRHEALLRVRNTDALHRFLHGAAEIRAASVVVLERQHDSTAHKSVRFCNSLPRGPRMRPKCAPPSDRGA